MSIPSLPRPGRAWLVRLGAALVAIWLVTVCALWWWWDDEPEGFDVVRAAQDRAAQRGQSMVVGSVTTATLIRVAETLLDKRGGYLSNDLLPPGAWMDNLPNWEFGALVQVRDLAKAMRNEFSRSQTQSTEDADLMEADPLFSSPSDRWLLPSSESQYRKAIEHLDAYLARLADDEAYNAQFYARADNLADWLAVVEKRLGSLSQRLSASVGQVRVDTDLAGDPHGRQSTATPQEQAVRTPWLEVDDVFYEARGATWALLHFLRAIEHDFEPVLRDKNALVSLRQIIRELEEAQTPLSSPVVLNGSPYGFFANHSLVMANYISRANAAVIDLRKLLERG
ncbi:MAG: hypothetical protein KatS3mg126_0927 [Lysobacteraceae bacterium]|nr:MAG: hypothetical protein KatS3mg126_0927 [Xanthomonadaceae bacterium]